MSRAAEEVDSKMASRTALRWLRGGVLLTIPIVLLGELGHHLLEQLGRTFAHHFFHIAFGAGAVLLFAVLVWVDVRRNGWPIFSWRPAVPATAEIGKSDSGLQALTPPKVIAQRRSIRQPQHQ